MGDTRLMVIRIHRDSQIKDIRKKYKQKIASVKGKEAKTKLRQERDMKIKKSTRVC